MIVSEYGIEPVDDAIHINKVLRRAGGVRVREEDGGELLDAGASDAFAVADHQVAHLGDQEIDHGQYDTPGEFLAPSGAAGFYRAEMLQQANSRKIGSKTPGRFDRIRQRTERRDAGTSCTLAR